MSLLLFQAYSFIDSQWIRTSNDVISDTSEDVSFSQKYCKWNPFTMMHPLTWRRPKKPWDGFIPCQIKLIQFKYARDLRATLCKKSMQSKWIKGTLALCFGEVLWVSKEQQHSITWAEERTDNMAATLPVRSGRLNQVWWSYN